MGIYPQFVRFLIQFYTKKTRLSLRYSRTRYKFLELYDPSTYASLITDTAPTSLRTRSLLISRYMIVRNTCARYFLNHGELVDADADASEESEADVLLGKVPVFGRPQDVLPRHQV